MKTVIVLLKMMIVKITAGMVYFPFRPRSTQPGTVKVVPSAAWCGAQRESISTVGLSLGDC